MDSALNTLLSNMQKWLASEYDWPFLADRWDVGAGSGARFVSVPTTAQVAGANTQINFERPVTFEIKWNQTWQSLLYGIGSDEFNYVDSDANERQDPVQRWQLAGEGKFEVWPLPNAGQTLRFTGQRALDALTADANVADLDDLLIVLFCAAELLANAGAKNAPIVLNKASQRLARLRGVYPARQATYIIGGTSDRGVNRIVPMKILAVHG
jgi:hypothetical protein